VAEQHVAEVGQLVDTYLTTKDGMEPISRDELLQRAKAGLVTVLDVRPVADTGLVICPARSMSP